MKRYGNLKEKILSDQNILEAEHNARRGKTSTYGVRRFDKRSDLSLDKIKQLLSDCSYKTSQYRVFKIYEPKERTIYQLPYYPDRIVHHILMNVLEQIFVKWFTKNTYSCIKGRGIHKMISTMEKSLRDNREGTKWCLKIDIKKFYPSIDQDILIKIINTKIKDPWLMQVLIEIIHSSDNGVPIGNYLSQFFANVYLNNIDHWAKEKLRLKHYYRYCDDIVVLGGNPEGLYKIYRLINLKLSFIKLRLKAPRLFLTDSGIDFAGYVLRHDYIKLRKAIKLRFKRIVNLYNKNKSKKCKRSISSYYGWLVHCDGAHLLKITINDLYYEFKKHYFKHCGVRTCIVGRCKKSIAV